MRIVLSCIKIGEMDIKDVKFSLLARRPDLLDISLDSLNSTETIIPTLLIINYVLERQILRDQDWLFLSCDRDKKKSSY